MALALTTGLAAYQALHTVGDQLHLARLAPNLGLTHLALGDADAALTAFQESSPSQIWAVRLGALNVQRCSDGVSGAGDYAGAAAVLAPALDELALLDDVPVRRRCWTRCARVCDGTGGARMRRRTQRSPHVSAVALPAPPPLPLQAAAATIAPPGSIIGCAPPGAKSNSASVSSTIKVAPSQRHTTGKMEFGQDIRFSSQRTSVLDRGRRVREFHRRCGARAFPNERGQTT